MRTLIILIVTWILSSNLVLSQTNQETVSLQITVTNITKNRGDLLVAVFNGAEKYMKDYSLGQKHPVNAESMIITFKNLPKGDYAVSVFHDVNSNDTFDSNLLGIPKEPYGFSNNPSTIFGPPKFEKASFSLDSENKAITIKL